MFYISQREWKHLPSSHHSFQKINIFMKFKKDREQTFNTSQTFTFSYLQMTMSKRCNKMTFLIWSLLHLINPGDIFPSRLLKSTTVVNKGGSVSLPPRSGSVWWWRCQEGGWSKEGLGRQAQFCHSSRYFGEQHFCT